MEDLLQEAVSMGHLSEVESLLSKGVNPKVRDDNGYNLLHIACSINDKAIVAVLLKYNVDIDDVDEAGNTPLHVACERGSLACAELLVENGARIDIKNDRKKTAVQLLKNKQYGSKLKALYKPRVVPSPAATESASKSPASTPPSGSSPNLSHLDMNNAQILAEKNQHLLEREEELIQREAIVRSKEAELKRKLNEIEAKSLNLASQRSQYETNEKQLRKMVDTHTKNEFTSAICVVKWKSISVKSKLGAGGFATVYKGIWRGTQVAVKRPFLTIDSPQHNLQESDYIDLFNREVKLLSKLRHPNIVMIMGACLEPDNLCMILELCKSDLFALLHDHSIELPPKKLLGFAIDAAQGLLYMHTHSPALLHRDVKTANMLISNYGELKITDFGYTTFAGEVGFVFNKHKLTEKANRGTPAYMAVECLKDEEVTTKSDVFSFGVVLWEIMTRKIPWQGKSPESIYAEVTTGSRLPIPTESHYPPALGELIQACWLEVPSERPSFKTILKTLRKIRKTFD